MTDGLLEGLDLVQEVNDYRRHPSQSGPSDDLHSSLPVAPKVDILLVST